MGCEMIPPPWLRAQIHAVQIGLEASMEIVRPALFAFCVLLSLAACSADPGDDEAARAVFEQVRTGQIDAIEAQLADEVRNDHTRATLEELRANYIPRGNPTSIETIQRSVFHTTNLTRRTTVDLYTYPDRTLIVTTRLLSREGQATQIESLHIHALSAEEAQVAPFSLIEKPVHQIAFFAAMCASVVLLMLTLAGVIFTKRFTRKWLWALIALLGGPILLMNWSTGALDVQVTFGLINTGVSRGGSPLDPWHVRFQIPIGAIITLSVLLPHWLNNAPSRHEEPTN